MVVGIIGILAAVAIPAYNNYTNRAARGVTESALLAASRQVNLNKSTGDKTLVGSLNDDITSKGRSLAFSIHDGTTDGEIIANAPSWCIAVDLDGSSGTKYQAGCINQGGAIKYQTPANADCNAVDTSISNKTKCEDLFCTYAEVTDPDDGSFVSATCTQASGKCINGRCN